MIFAIRERDRAKALTQCCLFEWIFRRIEAGFVYVEDCARLFRAIEERDVETERCIGEIIKEISLTI